MSAEEFEREVGARGREKYILRLYVTGMTSKSRLAIQTIKKICDENLKGRYTLEVIDIYKSPALAIGDQIVAAPTLIKKLPVPLRKYIGDMTDREKILMGLDLKKS